MRQRAHPSRAGWGGLCSSSPCPGERGATRLLAATELPAGGGAGGHRRASEERDRIERASSPVGFPPPDLLGGYCIRPPCPAEERWGLHYPAPRGRHVVAQKRAASLGSSLFIA